jgi:hypothetical protein
LTFLRRTRGNTGRNVKSATLAASPPNSVAFAAAASRWNGCGSN